VACQAKPLPGLSYPGLGHRHPVGLPAVAGIDVVAGGAPQNGRIGDDHHLRILKLLTVPPGGAANIGLQVGLSVEHFAGVRRPAELPMKQLPQRPHITGAQGGGTGFGSR
jgi:hypothetical protein